MPVIRVAVQLELAAERREFRRIDVAGAAGEAGLPRETGHGAGNAGKREKEQEQSRSLPHPRKNPPVNRRAATVRAVG